MKKSIITVLAAVAVAATSYGQGTVTFANTAATHVRIQTSPNDPTLISMPVGGGAVQLLWAPVGTTDLELFNPVQTPATANTTADGITRFVTAVGRFSGGAATVPGISAGGIAALVVRGWTGDYANWAEASAAALLGEAQIGWSSIFTIDTGDPTSIPSGTPTALTAAGGFTGLELAYVPEPSSMALAGLGAASLLIFRRRK